MDNTLLVSVIQPKESEDYQLKDIQLISQKQVIPAYLANALNEIVQVVQTNIQFIATFEIHSYTIFNGEFHHRNFKIFSFKDRLFLEVVISGYDEKQDWSDRTQFQIEEINWRRARESALFITKLFMLYADVFVKLGEGHDKLPFDERFLLSSGINKLVKISSISNRTQHNYHDNDQLIDMRSLVKIVDTIDMLPPNVSIKLKRSLHWIERFYGQSISDYLLFSAIAIESLIDNPVYDKCSHCGQRKFKEGATQAYRSFLEKHLPDHNHDTISRLAGKLYQARSGIVHNGRLSSLEDPAKFVKRAFSSIDDYTELILPIKTIKFIWQKVILDWVESHI